MILVDTSIWADHFRQTNTLLLALVHDGQIVCHPFVIGELAMGHLSHRSQTLRDLGDLRGCIVAETTEVLRLVEQAQLYGTGIGFVDAHLLASARLTPDVLIWTNDKRLSAAADRFSLGARPLH